MHCVVVFVDTALSQLDADKAYQLALGNLDTHSDRRLDNFDPDTYQVS